MGSLKNQTYAIVQARMGSTRLPGKVMLKIVGKPMLELMIERLRRASELDGIVVATTDRATERPIVDLINSLEGILLFRGSEDDVLARYHGAAVKYNAKTIVRVTADCPLIEPAVIDKIVKAYHKLSVSIDYASNIRRRTYPRGLDVEVFSFLSLDKARKEATLMSDREHVTEYILQRPFIFRMCDVVDDVDNSFMRWTVDMPEDFELITKIYESLYPKNHNFTYYDVLQLLKRNPDWNMINSHIKQKSYGE